MGSYKRVKYSILRGKVYPHEERHGDAWFKSVYADLELFQKAVDIAEATLTKSQRYKHPHEIIGEKREQKFLSTAETGRL